MIQGLSAPVMAFACNIDRRGRTLRTIAGAATLLIGVALLTAPLLIGGDPEASSEAGDAADRNAALLIGGIAACCGGAFMLFEGLVGWCAVRALGFRTPV